MGDTAILYSVGLYFVVRKFGSLYSNVFFLDYCFHYNVMLSSWSLPESIVIVFEPGAFVTIFPSVDCALLTMSC